MDGVFELGLNRSSLVDGLANDVHDAAQSLGTDGHLNGRAQIVDPLTSNQTIGGIQSDSAHSGVAQMLGNF